MGVALHTVIGIVAVNIAWFLFSIVSMVCVTTPMILLYRLLSHKIYSRRRKGTESIIFIVLIVFVLLKIAYYKTLQISMLYDLVIAYFLTRFWSGVKVNQKRYYKE